MSEIDKQETLDRLKDMGYTICGGDHGIKHVVMPDGNEWWVTISMNEAGLCATVKDALWHYTPVAVWGVGADTLDELIRRVMEHVCFEKW